MPDVSHTFGQDLTISPAGDIALSNGPALGLQRVLRRLLTNAGEYIWQPTYGAGLPAAVGQVANVPRIKAVIRAQMLQENAVARTPAPVITVKQLPNNTILAQVQYVDAESGTMQTVNLPVI